MGEPVYDFLTWQDLTSVYISVGIVSGFTLFYLGLVKLDQFVKSETLQQNTLKVKQE